MSERYIPAPEFGQVASISRQAAHAALAGAIDGKPWRGLHLQVRKARGTSGGGRAGIRYEVALSSLPEAYQKAFNDALPPLPLLEPPVPFVTAPNQGPLRERRRMILVEALHTTKGSPERKAALERAFHFHKIPVRTLQTWLKTIDDHGGDWGAFGRKRPSDAGRKRVAVTRKFDKAFVAAGYDAALLPELAERLTDFITGCWAGPPGRAGRGRVLLEASTAFRRLCREREHPLPDEAFALPPNVAEPYRHFRAVDMRANDRKAFDDAKPRIRRDNSLWGCLEHVCMDVHPIDILVTRPDGSVACPRLIGFMDLGTHRLYSHIVLCEPGESVRQEHVIEGFANMVADPEWGFPQSLYRDNGSEYFQFDKLKDALALVNDKGARTIVNAKPYSGASKPIESYFSCLIRFVFSQMEGWIGGNRMNKKVQTLGKPRAPYPGSFAMFVEDVQEGIRDYMGQPVGSGPFKGRVPLEIYADYVESGWRPVRIHPASLDAAFCTHDTRRVDRGFVSINGARYNHPDLPNGRTIDIALPYRRGARPLARLPGADWVELQPELLFAPSDRSGAVEAGRTQKTNERQVMALKRAAGSIDLTANRRDRLGGQRALPQPRRSVSIATGDDQPNFDQARVAAVSARQERVGGMDRETLRLERLNARLANGQ